MTNSPPYHLQVDLNLQEIEYFLFNQYTRRWPIRILIALAAVMALGSLYLMISSQNFNVVQGMILPLAVFVFLPLSIKSQAKKLYNSSNGQFKNNHFTFEEDKISIKNSTSQSSFSWNTIFKLEESKQQLLLYVNNTVAYVIPKSSFSSQQEQEQFVAFARRKMSQKA